MKLDRIYDLNVISTVSKEQRITLNSKYYTWVSAGIYAVICSGYMRFAERTVDKWNSLKLFYEIKRT